MDNFNSEKQVLIDAIAEEKKHLQATLEKENEELSFLSKIWEVPELEQIKLVANTDSVDMLTAILLADDHRTTSLSEIKELLEKNRDLYETIDSKQTRALIYSFADLDENDLYDYFKESITPGNKKITIAKAASVAFKLILKMSGVRNIDLYPFMESIDKFPGYLDALLCIKTAQDVTKTKRSLRTEIDKAARRTMKQIGLPEEDARKNFNTNTARKIILTARNYYDRIKQTSLSEKRALRRELAAYETLEESLDKLFNHDEIKNINDLLFRVSSPTVRLELMKLIYLHNKGIYDCLKEEYQKVSSDPSSAYQSLLDKYGISPDLYQTSDVMINPLEELAIMLQSLKELDITDANSVLEIIENSNLSTIRNIATQVSKGFISTELLKNNLTLFTPDSVEYKNFVGNLEFFIEEGINPHYLRVNQELFLSTPTTIKTNIRILEEYNLLSSMKTGSNCHFLAGEELAIGIDTLLELGYEASLVEDLSLLNYQHNFPRLQVLKALNIPVSSLEELKTVLSADRFLVPDDTIDTYLYNAASFQTTRVTETKIVPSTMFALFDKTERTYDINGIIVSKNKVKRNINVPDEEVSSSKLIEAIVSNSILSDEEYETVLSTITTSEKEPEYIKK